MRPYLHLREQFKHSIFIYFELPRMELGLSGYGASASICRAILPTLTRTPVPWKGPWATAQGLVMERGGRSFSGMHEALSLITYVTNTHLKTMISPPLAQQPRAFWSQKPLSKKETELWKWLVLRLGQGKYKLSLKRFCTRMEKKSLRNDGNMYKERDSLKVKSGTESYGNNDSHRLKPN